jgi:glycosyltransferase involved in cell wall biosynthesis
MNRRKPLRVGYLVKTYPRLSETFILNEILEMERQGVDVTILALKRPAERRFHEKLARVRGEVIYAPEVRPNSLVSFLAALLPGLDGLETAISELFWTSLRTNDEEGLEALIPALAFVPLLRERGLTHLHAHFATSATATAMRLARLTGVGYSFTAHAKDIFHESVSLERFDEKAAGARFVVAVSDWSAGYLKQKLSAPAAERVRRLYNGIDLSEFSRRERRSSSAIPLIASVGRLVPKKGFSTLLDAAHRLVRSGRRIRVEIAGEGEMRSTLENQIKALGLNGIVNLKGALSHDEVKELLNRADVFALPAEVAEDGNRDGLPVVLVEAMASGVPVISTPVVGIPEAVSDGVTGILVPEKSPEDLAAALARLFDEPDFALGLTRAARARVDHRFDARTNVAQLRDWFERAVDGSAGYAPKPSEEALPPAEVLAALGSPTPQLESPARGSNS